MALLTGALGHGRGAAALVLLVTGLPAALATRAGWPSRVRTALATLSLTAAPALLVPVTGRARPSPGCCWPSPSAPSTRTG